MGRRASRNRRRRGAASMYPGRGRVEVLRAAVMHPLRSAADAPHTGKAIREWRSTSQAGSWPRRVCSFGGPQFECASREQPPTAHVGDVVKQCVSDLSGRYRRVLMLLSLASACVVLLGAAAVELGWAKSVRASSLRRRVLSLFTVGSLVVRSPLLNPRPLGARCQSCQSHVGAPRAPVCRSLPCEGIEDASRRALRCPLRVAQRAQAPSAGARVHRWLLFGAVIRRFRATR